MSNSQAPLFWLMTTVNNGQTQPLPSYSVNYGTIWPDPGETRQDLFIRIRETVFERDPEARGGAVIAFDLQSNKIPEF